ncbi:hypothetical protein IC235_06015 [Hymenobacter sp. BT664]|uniref:Uncharacterized protein n=1 Tax=Hymenobacter montanus TaxID=2771359 RepID=A0A927BC75_9BACT|nr:hypothetical protein [Hymenobacter montanus]MBD2767444.1 hypothetical protein [Hymenobacter montanus]
MMVVHKAFFTRSMPHIEKVVEKMRDTTGLMLVYDDEMSCISCLENKMNVWIIEEPIGCYKLFKTSIEFDYLLASTLYVLISFGGEYEYKNSIPSWAGKRLVDIPELLS